MLKIKWDAVEIVFQSYTSHSMKAGVMELILKVVAEGRRWLVSSLGGGR